MFNAIAEVNDLSSAERDDAIYSIGDRPQFNAEGLVRAEIAGQERLLRWPWDRVTGERVL